MLIKAKEQIIEWDAERRQPCIINAGEKGECSDALAQALLDSGRAELPKGRRAAAKAAEPADPVPAAPVADEDAPPA